MAKSRGWHTGAPRMAAALLLVLATGALLGFSLAAGPLGPVGGAGAASPIPKERSWPAPPADAEADVVVYGATASGVMVAVSAARAGASVILLSPDDTIGGMVTSGLSRTDVARKDLVGGLTREFYVRVGRVYQVDRFGQSIAWFPEPHVARRVFDEMLSEAGVTVYRRARLASDGVERDGGRITALRLEGGAVIRGRVFADSTYEGDLMASAGVSYRIGREAASEYGESLAGVREASQTGVYGRYYESGGILPGISDTTPAREGTADGKTQAFTYRLCVTNNTANRVPFPIPADYDPRQYVLVERALGTWTKRTGQVLRLADLVSLGPLPGDKADLNNAGLFSTDLVGGSWNWAEASSRDRDAISRRHWDWQAGLLEFLRTSDVVPAEVRRELSAYGLCADEFQGTANWPPLLYVREARRMVGTAVISQRDVQEDVRKRDPIGVGSYRIDSHYVERLLDPRGYVVGEGQLNAPVEPYDIPMRILLPRRADATNLVVSVAVSATHVAFASLRMEPQFMTMGEAAGVIASLAAKTGRNVQDVPYPEVAAILSDRRGILTPPPAPSPAPTPNGGP